MASVGGETNDVLARSSRPRSLIITMYGAYSRQIGGWFSVSSLLTMLRSVEVDEASARGALSRLKRKGVLESVKHGNTAGYLIGEATRRVFELGDARVLERRQPPLEAGWILATFSIPETERDVRYRLRSGLEGIGLGQVSPGFWIGPRHLEADIRQVVSRLGVDEYVDLFSASHMGFNSTADAVATWWDLDAIGDQYAEFTAAFTPMGRRWARASGSVDRERAFADYTRALTAWRPIPYLDPGLPATYLPRRWPGTAASKLFFELHDRLAAPAATYVREVIT